MPTKFSQFVAGGAATAGDIVVGLRSGLNTQFNAQSLANLPWSTLITNAQLVMNNGYFMSNGTNATFTIPTTATVGQIIQVINYLGSTFTLAQNAGQTIVLGSHTTTMGIGGSLQSTAAGDALTLVCAVANNGFVVLGAPQGNWILT